ncbi:MAK10-like protein [Tanacetum coccineum]
MEDPRLFSMPCRSGNSKPFDTLADGGSCVNIIPLYLFKKLNIGLLEETDHIFGLADGTKSYPNGIVKDVEVHIGKLKLLNDFYVIDMKKDPETPLLVGRGFLATANAVIDYKMAKIAIGEGITRSVFGVKGANLGAIPINLKSKMWELEGLIKNLINWDKPPKNGDEAWHAKIRLIDPDRKEFTKILQSIPTTRNSSERDIPREIIDLDHFYNTGQGILVIKVRIGGGDVVRLGAELEKAMGARIAIGITSYGYRLWVVSSSWSFVSAVLGQMTYLVASPTLDSARTYVM